MSLVEVNESNPEPEVKPLELAQCCNTHILVNSRISLDDSIHFQELNGLIELQRLRSAVKEKDHLIASLQNENLFLREQVRSLNVLLDQLAVSTRNMANKNDIRIRVENAQSATFKKWYKRPKVILSGSAVMVLFSIYLRYKIKNW